MSEEWIVMTLGWIMVYGECVGGLGVPNNS